jgi:hypothetical protein
MGKLPTMPTMPTLCCPPPFIFHLSNYEFGFCHSERSEEALEKKEILLFLHGVYPELVKGSGLRMTKS